MFGLFMVLDEYWLLVFFFFLMRMRQVIHERIRMNAGYQGIGLLMVRLWVPTASLAFRSICTKELD